MNKPTNKVISVFRHGSAKRLYFEFFDNTGKKKQKSTGLADTPTNRRKAERELIPLFEQRLKEEALKEKSYTLKPLSFYAESYHKSLKNSSHSKLGTHASRIKRIVEYFGSDTLLSDITELDIEEFFESLEVSRDTKSDWKVVLGQIFERGRKGRAIETNIVKQYEIPKSETQNTPDTVRMPFSLEEAKVLIENADRRLRNYLGISFFLGTRPEETIGLMLQDIDMDKQTIYLQRAITKGTVKTITGHKGGPRDIPIFVDAIPFLEDQIAWAQEKNSLYLFFDNDGHRLHDIIDIRGSKGKVFYWNDYLTQLGITPHRRLMNTRHTFAINCIKNMDVLGITLNDIASIMGHSSLRMLIQHYGKYISSQNMNINRNISFMQGKSVATEYSTES
jgi:integrase